MPWPKERLVEADNEHHRSGRMLGITGFASSRPKLFNSRTARKRNSSVWAITQTLEDFVGTDKQPRLHGPGIVKNSTTKIIGQQRGDLSALANHLYLNDVVLREIKSLAPPRKGRSAEAVLALGERAETTEVIRLVPTPIDYWVCTTFQRERM